MTQSHKCPLFSVTSKYFLNPLDLGFLMCTLGTRESYLSERVRFVCDGARAVPGLRKCSAASMVVNSLVSGSCSGDPSPPTFYSILPPFPQWPPIHLTLISGP